MFAGGGLNLNMAHDSASWAGMQFFPAGSDHGNIRGSSFSLAREEAGQSFSSPHNQKVSHDLLRRLQDHAAADEKTQKLLWDMVGASNKKKLTRQRRQAHAVIQIYWTSNFWSLAFTI